MTRSRATRSSAISVAVLVLLGAGWLVFAPTRFGGSTDYVTTHGISMEPGFHTGDLALVRPAARYRVGDVVAYHSDLLHTVVLHRIVGRDRDRYVFKGDNNDFIDPAHPSRSQLIGKLWIHVPGGGAVLGPPRRPPVVALVIGGVAAMFLLGAGAKRRRRTRRRSPIAPVAVEPVIAPEPSFVASLAAAPPAVVAPVGAVAASVARASRPPVVAPAPPPLPRPALAVAVAARPPVVCPAPPALPAPALTVAKPTPHAILAEAAVAPQPLPPAPPSRIDRRRILSGSGIAALVFLVLALLGFAHRTTKPVAVQNPYTQSFAFGYHAHVPAAAAPVYPKRSLTTGDPVFLRLVHSVQIRVGYRFAAAAPHRLAGTLEIVGRISGPTGWTQDIRLAPPQPFSGNRAEGVATLDLLKIRRLTRAVERLTGMPSGGTYTLAVVPEVRAAGTLAGEQIHPDFSSQMSFQLDPLQLRPGGASLTGAPDRHGSVTSSRTATNTLGLHGHEVPVRTIRGIAAGGLLLAALAALIGLLPRFRGPEDAGARVRARYGHLIVPIAGLAPNAPVAPIDVTTMDALVALAERSERLILHHRDADAETYLVDDAGTLFRHRIPTAA